MTQNPYGTHEALMVALRELVDATFEWQRADARCFTMEDMKFDGRAKTRLRRAVNKWAWLTDRPSAAIDVDTGKVCS